MYNSHGAILGMTRALPLHLQAQTLVYLRKTTVICLLKAHILSHLPPCNPSSIVTISNGSSERHQTTPSYQQFILVIPQVAPTAVRKVSGGGGNIWRTAAYCNTRSRTTTFPRHDNGARQTRASHTAGPLAPARRRPARAGAGRPGNLDSDSQRDQTVSDGPSTIQGNPSY